MALTQVAPTRIIDSRHPSFMASMNDWENWRLTYQGGEDFKNKFLERFNSREDNEDFQTRKRVTPVPAFAKSAVNDIRNSIFQRMCDVTRTGGSIAYRQAVAGQNLGVDRRGNTMSAFLGMKVLSDLLVMGRCGIYVDNSVVVGESVADSIGARPYLYAYQVEDILSFTSASADNPSEFQALLVRDSCMDYDRRTMLPMQTFQRFRLLWLEDGYVMLQFFNAAGEEIDRDGNPGGPVRLELNRIPFVMPDIGDSLIKDVWRHQVALLNLASRDVWYALQSNFPFYIEQRDMRAIGTHLKQASTADGTATTGGQGAGEQSIMVGAGNGRAYGKDMDAPAFINPSPEPLLASIGLQEKLEADIRKLVNLSVQSIATRGSAESKSLDNQGLEAGLSYIGLVLASAEQQIAQFWAAYENKNVKEREVATVKYPDRYSLKTDADRIEECAALAKLIYTVPGRKAKIEIAKNIITVLLSGKVDVGTIDKIHAEIDGCDYLTSDPDTIIAAVEAGLCDEKTGSEALGFAQGIFLQARLDHAARAARVAQAQASVKPGAGDPGARGVADLSADPKAAAAEKAASSDPTLQGGRARRQRGKNKGARVSGATAKGE